MIATGGLLRISARRQDSTRSKNCAANKRKRKAKKKKKSDVVVVKGKLKLCSISGLVAVLGIVVLLVGIAMAVLGYWPKEGPVYLEQALPKETTKAMRIHDKTLSDFSSWVSNNTVVHRRDEILTNGNHSNNNETDTPAPFGYLNEFLERYLYSDKLKVFGPLIMGIGIFLFICANAVLHENRDKKTKIINLRDIYSTVIDVHSLRTKESVPLNGYVNYMQPRAGEGRQSPAYRTSMLARSSWPSTVLSRPQDLWDGSLLRRQSFGKRYSLCRERQTFTETVYSIYKEQSRAADQGPISKLWETSSIVPSSVNTCTLPVIKLNNSAEGNTSWKAEKEDSKGRAEDCEPVKAGCSSSSTFQTELESQQTGATTLPATVDVYKSTGSLQEAPQGSQVQLLPPSPCQRATGSHLSLSALSDYSTSIDLGICPSTPAGWQVERTRRFSCPRLEHINSRGYIKLGDQVGESFESAEIAAPSQSLSVEELPERDRHPVVVDREGSVSDSPYDGIKRQFSNKEKLLMIAKATTTLDEEGLKSTGI